MSAIRPPSPTTTATVAEPDDLASISSLDDFEQKYKVIVDSGKLALAERGDRNVVYFTQTPAEDHLCTGYDDAHLHNGVYYYVFSSKKYTSKTVIGFDLKQRSIKHVLNSAHDVKFLDNIMVNFGTGFNAPGDQVSHHCPEGVFTVYDLNKPHGNRTVKTVKVPDCTIGGFDGSIDEKTREIHAFDHVRGGTRKFRIDDLV